MSLTFKRTGDEDYPRYLKVLVQGNPKAGKTTFAATAPNVVFLAMPDAGLMSIAHKNVPYREIEEVDELRMIAMALGDDVMRGKLARSLGMTDIETVVIDTLDALQEMQKKAILKANRATEMRQADWGKLKEHLSAIVKMYVALPMNVIFTVHTTTIQDDEQRIISVPALQGAIKDEIAGWVDHSLLAERKREIGKDGKPHISYLLKAEGDQKNPHLGNRAAGRLPEYIEPDFQILHDAVFKDIDALIKTQVIADAVEVSAEAEVSAEVEAPVPADAAPAKSRQLADKIVASTKSVANGTPAPVADGQEHINSAGVKALTKNFTELDLSVPDFDQEVWTLSFARELARFIVACKADEKLGRGNAADEVVKFLSSHEINVVKANYVSPDVAKLSGIETLPTSAPKKVVPKKVEVQADASTTTEATEEQAIATLETQVGAVVIGEKVSENATCAECSGPIDDLDIATLAVTRYRRPLCLKDYMAANKAAK